MPERGQRKFQHVLSVGSGTSPGVDILSYSGSSSGSFTYPSKYPSWSASPSSVENSGFSLSWSISEFINYIPAVVNSNVATPVNPLTPLDLYANATEAISGELQNLAVSANGKPYIYSSPTSSESLVSPSFYFRSTGEKTVSWFVHNDPNGNPYPGSELNSSVQTATVNVLPFSLTPSPVDYSSVGTSVVLSLAYSTQTSAKMTIINLTVNGVLEDRFQPDLASGKVKYDFSQPVSAPLLVTWQAVDQYGYSQSITFQYGSNLTPSEYSNTVSVLQSPNATHSYPITLSGVPTGTGYYQQLLNISNPSQYGINTAGSNIQFTAQNGTLLYAWIQSINSTSMQVWVKNYNDSSVIDMQVFPSFENLFSANGYLGDTDYPNQKYVFESVNLSTVPSGYTVITNNSGISAVYGSDGLTIYDNTTAGGNAYYMLYSSLLFPQDSIVIVNETGSIAVDNTRSIQPGFVATQSTTLIDKSNNYSVAFSNGRDSIGTYSAFQGNETNPNYMSDPYASGFSDYTIFVSYTGGNEIYYGNGLVSSSVDSPSGSVYLGIGIANYKPPTADYSFTN